jgi:hypothetical protein
MINREQELKLLQEFIEKNGATKLLPDKRIEFNSCPIHPWRRSKASLKKRPKKKKSS